MLSPWLLTNCVSCGVTASMLQITPTRALILLAYQASMQSGNTRHSVHPPSPDAHHLEAMVCKLALHVRKVREHLAAGTAPACIMAQLSVGSLLDLAHFQKFNW